MHIDHHIEQQARQYQNTLTKPQGSLGKLEDIACWFAARQGKVIPENLQAGICVFAGDHGVVEEGVSAFPSIVTTEMLKNFVRGGAAINVLARQCKAQLQVVDVAVANDCSAIDGLVHANIRAGTGNLAREAAMTKTEYQQALQVGRQQARVMQSSGCNLLIAGDMGIGNTTASACIICLLSGLPPENVVGHGTGVDEAAFQQKLTIVHRALRRVESMPQAQQIIELCGLEIAAMAGFYLEAAQLGTPIIIDGFIAAAAAMVARSHDDNVCDWMLASHVSQELGHRAALHTLGLQPLLDFGMRLGEGSGAALIIPLLQSAVALHREMATFADAGVSEQSND